MNKKEYYGVRVTQAAKAKIIDEVIKSNCNEATALDNLLMKQPKETVKEIVKEIPQPLEKNQILITMDDVTLRYIDVNADLIKQYGYTNDILANKALQFFLKQLK
jgi:putative N-acetylmannosamine-6-phosphate epimerase